MERRVTVELDADLVDAARAVARRTGVAEIELYERAIREVLARDFAELMDSVQSHQKALGERLSDHEAMDLAKEELRAVRARTDR